MRYKELNKLNYNNVIIKILDTYKKLYTREYFPREERTPEQNRRFKIESDLIELSWKKPSLKVTYNTLKQDKDTLKIFKDLKSKDFLFQKTTIHIRVPLKTQLEHSGSDYCLRYYMRRELNKQNKVLVCPLKQEQLKKTKKYRYYKIEMKTKEREQKARLPTVEEKKARQKEIILEKAIDYSDSFNGLIPCAGNHLVTLEEFKKDLYSKSPEYYLLEPTEFRSRYPN